MENIWDGPFKNIGENFEGSIIEVLNENEAVERINVKRLRKV